MNQAAAPGQVGSLAPGPLLPKGRLTGPMPWVIAIMMFLTVLASAVGLSFDAAAQTLSAQVSDRITVQIVQADAELRNRAVRRIVTLLGATEGVSDIAIVPPEQLAAQLEPWLGADMKISDIPVPALIDADLRVEKDARDARLAALDRAVKAIDASARIEPHARYLAPLAGLVTAIGVLAFGLVALMVAATGAVVVLAARGAHATHRGTIDIMHVLGATDGQVVSLFQRRMVLDAAFGTAIGAGIALVVIALLGQALHAVTSDLVRSASLPARSWLILLVLPLAGVAMSWLAARVTLHRALERSL